MIAPKIGGAMPKPVRKPNSTIPDARPVAATPASTITATIPTEFHELDPTAISTAAGHSSHTAIAPDA